MKRLHLFVIRSFSGPFFMTFFISIFVLLMQFVWKYLDDFVGKGLDTAIIIELMVYAAAGLVPLALPLAMLLASLMTFGNLGENNELLALKAAGISLLRILKPLLVLSVFISIGAYFFANNVVPYTNQKFYALLSSIKQQKPELIVKEGIFSSELEDISIKVGKKDKKSNTLYDILIYDHRKNDENTNVTVADSGYLKITEDKQQMILTLFDGERYMEGDLQEKRRIRQKKQTFPFRREEFKIQTTIIPIKGFDFERKDEDRYKKTYKTLSSKNLTSNRDSLLNVLDKRRDFKLYKYQYNTLISSAIARKIKPDSLKQSIINLNHELKPMSSEKTIIPEKKYLIIDSIYQAQNCKKKSSIVSKALEIARNNQKMIIQNIDDFKVLYIWIRKHDIELHRKFTLSFACLIFFLIGAPLGAIIRKGGLGMPVVVSVFLFIIYYIFSMITEKAAREGGWSISEGMWTSSFVFLIFGIFLTYKAANDSVILNIDTYFSFIKKLLPKKLVKIFSQKDNDENSSDNQ